jgi:tetratricopeptide (TPR) repeat protein
MGKTRPPERNKVAKGSKHKKQMAQQPTPSPAQLLEYATSYLHTSEPDKALKSAVKALRITESKAEYKSDASNQLPALNLLGEINVELGEIDAAREYFRRAADIDEDGQIVENQGGGAEKFMWLAQLSEEGGLDSVRWFEKGAEVLRIQIRSLLERDEDLDAEPLLQEKRLKLANALCSIAEVYMTDLSWDDENAEEQCNKVMDEALAVGPDSPETLQTAASVRISQLKLDEARLYLKRSLELWKDLDPEDSKVPDFPIRISLSRLLMEAEMEDDAIEVLERLIAEDDSSVEAWYLGGWCLHLLADKQAKQANGKVGAETAESINDLLRRSRRWLQQCLNLYQLLGYEDERLQEHALELVRSLNQVLGEPDEAEEAAAAEEDDWEDDGSADEDEDEEMEET